MNKASVLAGVASSEGDLDSVFGDSALFSSIGLWELQCRENSDCTIQTGIEPSTPGLLSSISK